MKIRINFEINKKMKTRVVLNVPRKQGNKHLRVAYIHYSDRAVFVPLSWWGLGVLEGVGAAPPAPWRHLSNTDGGAGRSPRRGT